MLDQVCKLFLRSSQTVHAGPDTFFALRACLEPVSSQTTTPTWPAAPHRLIVMYIHGTVPCWVETLLIWSTAMSVLLMHLTVMTILDEVNNHEHSIDAVVTAANTLLMPL